MSKKLLLNLVVDDKGTVKIQRFGKQAKKSMMNANSGTTQLSSSLSGLLTPSIVGVTAVLAGMAVGLVKVTKTGMQFESTMKMVQAVSGANAEQFKQLEAAALRMGATTEHSATQSAQSLKYLSMAGLDVQSSLTALPGMLDLATAAQMDLGTASDIVTDTLTAFGMETDELSRLSDAFIATATKSNTTTQMLGESFKYVAPIAAQMGYEVEQTAAYLGVLANAGIKASDAGTDMRQVLLRTGKAAKKLGIEGASLAEVLTTMKERQFSANQVTELYGMIASKSAMVLMNNTEAVADLNAELEKSAGITKRVAEVMRDSAENDWKIMMSAIQDVSLGMFEAFGPDLRLAIQETTKAIQDNKAAFVELGVVVAGGMDLYTNLAVVFNDTMDAIRPFGRNLYETFKFGFQSSGAILAVFAADTMTLISTMADGWMDLGNIMYSAITFNFDGIKKNWALLVSRGGKLNGELGSNWNSMVAEIDSDWAKMAASMMQKNAIVVADTKAAIESSVSANAGAMDIITDDTEKASKTQIKIEEKKANVIKNIFSDMVSDSLDAANEMIGITEKRVNKEISLEQKKYQAIEKASNSFTISTSSNDQYKSRYNYARQKWEQVANPNYRPTVAAQNDDVTADLITTSNNYLSSIASTETAALSAYNKQTDILKNAFGSVSDLSASMSIGSLAPSRSSQSMGLEYAGLLSVVKATTGEAQESAIEDFAKFVPDFLESLSSSSSNYLAEFKSIKKDVDLLALDLGSDIFKQQLDIMPESIKMSDFVTFDWADLQNDIDTGKLSEANAKVLELMGKLQTGLPGAVSTATGGQGIEGFNAGLISTLYPLSNASGNTETATSNVANNLVAMGDMFTSLASSLADTTIPSITESIQGIADAAAQGSMQEAYLQNWVPFESKWSLFSVAGRLIQQGGPTWGHDGSGGIYETAPPAAQYVPYARKGGLMTQPTIGGEAGPEWAVPTYEPERSNFLKSVGVDTDAIANKIASKSGGGGGQVISVQIDGREIARAIAKQGKSSPDLVKMIREIA